MMRQMGLALVALGVIAAAVPLAWAHPFIDDTSPQRLSSAPVGTQAVTVWYSEGVELDFSSLKVYDSSGNQVDRGDTAYHEGDTSLRVSTSPLEEGVYTVASSVLSRVDGHLVGGAFIFAVGGAMIDAAAAESVAPVAQVFLPEAAARVPGLVGQSMVLGAAVAMLLTASTWRALGVMREAESVHRSRFMALIGAGAVMVLASNMLMLAAQSFRLEASVLDALGTTFGGTLAARIGITVALIAAWFVAERSGAITKKWSAVFAALGLALAMTMTMVGHGAASEGLAPAVLDYAHNVIAGVWIGGTIYLLIAILPSISRLGERADTAALVAIPTFSAIFVLCVGIAAITGPLLMWFLEDSVASIVGSTYGTILGAKIAIGSAMIALGAYNSAVIVRGARRAVARLTRSLRLEAALGVALLGAVALLTNTTLPGGEAIDDASPALPAGLRTTEFTPRAAFDVTVWPMVAGSNTISVTVVGSDGEALDDLEGVRVKLSNPQHSISPIEVAVEDNGVAHTGELTLGFWGEWQIDVEALRSEAANESVSIGAFAKPLASQLSFEITEYDMPDGAVPLQIVHDGQTVWMSDPSAPRVWSLDRRSGEFSAHTFDGVGSLTLSVAADRTVWFADSQSASIGWLDPQTREATVIGVPGDIGPPGVEAMPTWIHAARDGTVWVSVLNWNMVLEYDPASGEFVPHVSPTPESRPFGLAEDNDGRIWFAELTGGKVGRIDPASGAIDEFAPDSPLSTAETITIGPLGGIWISEHTEGGGIARLDAALGTFSRVAAPEERALPNSVSFDNYRNAWFALHTVDALAIHDTASGELVEVPLPTQRAQTQFTATDADGNVWFAEPGASKVGLVRISAPPPGTAPAAPSQAEEASYAELVAPIIGITAVAAPLLAVNAIRQRRVALSQWGNSA